MTKSRPPKKRYIQLYHKLAFLQPFWIWIIWQTAFLQWKCTVSISLGKMENTANTLYMVSPVRGLSRPFTLYGHWQGRNQVCENPFLQSRQMSFWSQLNSKLFVSLLLFEAHRVSLRATLMEAPNFVSQIPLVPGFLPPCTYFPDGGRGAELTASDFSLRHKVIMRNIHWVLRG